MPVDSPHDLYGLPLDRFIAERAALVKALRAEKRREEAGEVAALHKPSVAAWAVNQLVRTQTKEMDALLAAGDDLMHAQADAAAGKRAGDAIREASRRQRDAVSQLLQAAEGLLSSDGHPLSQATLERVGDTLRAAAIDQEARRQVRDGCLAHELRFVGLGILGDLAAAPPQAAPKPKGPAPKAKPPAPRAVTKTGAMETDAARRKAEASARAEAERKRKAELKAARQAETDARRAATRAEKELAAAQTRRDEAAASLTEAEHLLADAESTAERAATELRNAERAVGRLTDESPPR